MDMLQLSERVQNSIQLGESHFREFKSAWEGPPSARTPRDAKMVAKDISETLVGFANADGGELIVGVEDDGTVTGIPLKEDTIAQLLQAPRNNVHRDTPLDGPLGRRLTLGEHEVLYFAVEKSTRFIHQTSDGRCLQRKDRETVPVSSDKLQFERQEQLSREYDRQFVDGAKVSDLDLDLVQQVSQQLGNNMSPEKCLQYLGLAEYGMSVFRLRRAALLLFAKDVSRWHPRCEVRIVRVRGTELKTGAEYNAISDKVTTGNVLKLLSSAWDQLRPHLVQTKLGPDATFKGHVMYPEGACLEALTNAIGHRDYAIEGRGIEVYIFDDRMEVVSPGGLLSTVKLDELRKLQGLHQSRNALIAKGLREAGYMREMGEGLRRMFLLMRNQDLIPPELKSEPSRFSVILRHKSVFSDADQRWLDGFRDLKLTREEMLVALIGKGGNLISSQQIFDTLNLVDWDVHRSIVTQLQTKGVLYSEVPRQKVKSRARSQKNSQRAVPRFRIRQPEECERALSELFVVLGKSAPVSVVTESYVAKAKDGLSSWNPYSASPTHQMSVLLKLIGLVDEHREPTALMHAIWRTHRGPMTPIESPIQADTAKPAPVVRNPTERTGIDSAHAKSDAQDVWVGNLPYNTDVEEFEALFRPFGEIEAVNMPVLPGGKLRGFGFVRMRTSEAARAAISALDGQVFLGRALSVKWANKRTDAVGLPVHRSSSD